MSLPACDWGDRVVTLGEIRLQFVFFSFKASFWESDFSLLPARTNQFCVCVLLLTYVFLALLTILKRTTTACV